MMETPWEAYAIDGLKLRQLREEDGKAIFALQDVILKNLPDATWYFPSTEEQFAACCKRGECFGYFSRGKLAGFATLTPWHARPGSCYAGKLGLDAENTYDVQDVMVAPAYRRRGIHSNLLALFEEIVRALGGRALYATVAPDNVPSCRSFEKAGYTRMQVQPAYEGMLRAYYCKDI